MKRIFILLSALLMTLSLSAQVERSIFSLTLNPTPSLNDRIVIGQVGSLSENMTMQQFIDFTTTNLDVYSKSQIDIFFTNYLSKDNLVVYTPTQDYHPATKLLVDGGYNNVTWTNLINGNNMTVSNAKVAQRNGYITITCRYESDQDSFAGKILFTLPNSIQPPSTRIDFGAANASSQNNEGQQLYIDSGSRDIRLAVNGDDNVQYSFCITYPLF